jgi:hypothetical protein
MEAHQVLHISVYLYLYRFALPSFVMLSWRTINGWSVFDPKMTVTLSDLFSPC